jgi:3-hydroxyisobutyrate dehydrogenase-like beta-hydroxyacid dehydrogenase
LRHCEIYTEPAIIGARWQKTEGFKTMPNGKPTLAFLGFGEAGQAIAAGLRETGVERMSAWDILLPKPEGEKLRRAGAASGVHCANSAAEAVRDADIVICAVTAASSVEAARSVKAQLAGKPFFLDINSVSPGRKQETARLLGDGARYVDVAVLAPIHPARHQTPMLLAGPDAGAVAPALTALGMRATIGGAEVGAAAAIKMVRSVMIKGIEALTLECFLAAARAGVIDEVAASMKNNYPGLDWAKIVPYNLERMANHGERRAAEMEEVADTLRELGVEPLMTNATVKRQREMGQIGAQQSVQGVLKKDRAAMLGAISAAARDRH